MYVANKDSEVTLLHVVRDLAGAVHTSSATGFSVVVLDQDQNSESGVVTWSEPVATGYLELTLTPNALGNWLVRVTDPAAVNNGLESEYAVQVVNSAAGLTPTGTWLTTRANVKEALGYDSNTNYDDLLDNLIARASVMIESRLGRSVVQASYTEYVDGDGSEYLNLRQGPVISVTGLAYATHDSSGITTTSVDAGTYITYGNEADWLMGGFLRSNGGCFNRGRKNYEVKYSAGWAAVPYDIEQLAIDVVTWLFNQRKDAGNDSRTVGDGSKSFRTREELIAHIDAMLAPYKTMRVA